MTTRVQEKQYLQQFSASQLLLCPLEKAMLNQVSFNALGKVLDGNACTGQIAEYLLKNTNCHVCGISDQMEAVRQMRSTLYGGDFVYAAIGDIPWPENSFDVALMHPSDNRKEALLEQLAECKRVLKPGGQLVLGIKSLPLILRRMENLWRSVDENEWLCFQNARQILEKLGFERVSGSQVGLGGYVLTGWMSDQK